MEGDGTRLIVPGSGGWLECSMQDGMAVRCGVCSPRQYWGRVVGARTLHMIGVPVECLELRDRFTERTGRPVADLA